MTKRYRIVNRVRFTAFVCICVLLFIFITSALLGFSNSEAMDADKFIQVEVMSGDTLWSLASTYGPEHTDIRKTIYEIEKINDVTASSLRPGQILDIPVK